MWSYLTSSLVHRYLTVSLNMQSYAVALCLTYHRTQILQNDVYKFYVAYQVVINGSIGNGGVARNACGHPKINGADKHNWQSVFLVYQSILYQSQSRQSLICFCGLQFDCCLSLNECLKFFAQVLNSF